jgi:flagellin
MASTINTNVMSLNAQRNLSSSQASQASAMQRLSSGLRVNSAKDDAAGLAIAERLQSQVRGMNVAVRNANDAVSLTQTAEGAIGKIGDSLQRMRELAVQARNATNSDDDRASLHKEFGELQDEIKRVIDNTSFNGKKLLNGDGDDLAFQIGANTAADNRITIKKVDFVGAASLTNAVDADATKSTADVVLSTAYTKQSDGADGIYIGGFKNASTTDKAGTSDIDTAINVIDKALDRVSEQRATYGAAQNRFNTVIESLQINIENASASRGRIMDADFAVETANFSKSQILLQAGNAMLAQANQAPQQVLSLLRF